MATVEVLKGDKIDAVAQFKAMGIDYKDEDVQSKPRIESRDYTENKIQKDESQFKRIENQSKSDETQEEQQEYTDFEKEQMEDGWNPKGRKSAREWAENKALLKEITASHKESKELRKAIAEMAEHNKKLEKIAYDKALADLNAERNQAILNKDIKAVDAIEAKKAALEKQNVENPGIHFQEKYKDLLSDTSLEAIEIQDWLFNHDINVLGKRGLSPTTHVQLLEQHLEDYLERKGNTKFSKREKKESKKDEQDPVESGSQVKSVKSDPTKKKYTLKDLSPSQRDAAHKFAKYSSLSIDTYIDQLAAVGAIK